MCTGVAPTLLDGPAVNPGSDPLMVQTARHGVFSARCIKPHSVLAYKSGRLCFYFFGGFLFVL